MFKNALDQIGHHLCDNRTICFWHNLFGMVTQHFCRVITKNLLCGGIPTDHFKIITPLNPKIFPNLETKNPNLKHRQHTFQSSHLIISLLNRYLSLNLLINTIAKLTKPILFLWRNNTNIVIGKHQNPWK